MKCSNKRRINQILFLALTGMLLLFAGCGTSSYELPYNANNNASVYNVITDNTNVTPLFAEELCVSTDDILNSEINLDGDFGTAILFDINNSSVIYSKNAHDRMSPASLTKVMTALVALKYGQPDMVLTASNQIYIDEPGAQLCGIKPGDTMTLNQALYIALLNSANDAALLIAENIGGNVEGFIQLMNEEAKRLGATNTNFENPHGLTADGQYTTSYDLYLILNEAIKYEKFLEIIQTSDYDTTFYDKSGKAKQITIRNTNKYINGDFKAPDNVTVIGGKTGTTNAAGHCLMLLSKDNNGSPYISVILKAGSRDSLYAQMTELLEKITK